MPKNVLFVCTGNTCRSSMAEALMSDMLKKAGKDLKGVKVNSAGISALPGDPAPFQAQTVMGEQGIDISGHRARRLDKSIIKEADIVLVMTKSHKDAVLKAHPEAQGRVFLLKEFAGVEDAKTMDISDPFGQTVEVYRRTAQEIQESLTKILKRLAD